MKKLLAISLFAACAHTPPQELVDARAEYARAAAGPAAQLAPAELHVAAEQIAIAEHTYKNHPDSDDARDTAYIALRKVQRAEALGQAAADSAAAGAASVDYTKTQGRILSEQEKALAAQRDHIKQQQGALANARDAADQARDEADQARGAAQAERDARIAAEQKAQQAIDALAVSMELKKDDRGTIITLSGGVLFVTNQATLLAGAQASLDKVVDALKAQKGHTFVVGGHTDNTGTDAINDSLSQRRAQSVRDYLVSHGVDASLISAQGFGSHQPIADNTTLEGRAMNRRVEIIVKNNPTTAQN